MSLTAAQIADFKRDGYLHLHAAIPDQGWRDALHTINHRVGAGLPAEQLQTWSSQSFFPDLQQQPIITDLFNASGLRSSLQSLMAKSSVAPTQSGQLALRFPQRPDAQPQPPRGHIDGVHSPHNGVPAGELYSFSALVGVFLTDVESDDAGNFTVWPGSHLKMQDYFREHGINGILRENKTPPIDKGQALQIKAKAGDAVLAHYQLLHGVASNASPFARYAIFFRVKHPDHETHKLQCLTDLWREWDGVRA